MGTDGVGVVHVKDAGCCAPLHHGHPDYEAP